jgi:hypothetical protein
MRLSVFHWLDGVRFDGANGQDTQDSRSTAAAFFRMN